MSIAKPFTFTANTYAKASEVNADFDTVYAQVNTNISDIAQNATDIDNLENNKADINGSSSQRFAVADPITNADAVNKQTLFKAIGNSIDIISGLTISKDSGSPEDTILVSPGSCYDSTHAVVLTLSDLTSKQNSNQGASTTYYVYIIGNATGSSIDILISSNSVTPELPSGYTLYRKIGYYTTNSDSEINLISYYGQDVTSDKSANGIANLIMPNYSAGVSVSNGDTMVGNGYCTWTVYTESGFSGIEVNGVGVGAGGFSYGNQDGSIFPVSQGDIVTWSGGRNWDVNFYPLKGVN